MNLEHDSSHGNGLLYVGWNQDQGCNSMLNGKLKQKQKNKTKQILKLQLVNWIKYSQVQFTDNAVFG